MREIKFRGLSKETNQMIYGDLIHSPSGGMAIVECEQFTVKSSMVVIPETVGQFTGLKDKNGKKIYGGDIVKYNRGGYFNDGPFEVTYGEAHFSAGEPLLIGDFNADRTQHIEIEIIGNIHENPELLSGEKEKENA